MKRENSRIKRLGGRRERWSSKGLGLGHYNMVINVFVCLKYHFKDCFPHGNNKGR